MKIADFCNDGQSLKIFTAKTPMPWVNYLFNDEYVFECSQRLNGNSFSVQDYKRKPVLSNNKHFFVKIDGETYRLCAGLGEKYECEHYIYKTVVTEVFDRFISEITVFVPTRGKRELWRIKLCNRTNEKLNADVFATFEFANIDYQGLECHYNEERKCIIKKCFPYYITYSEYDTAKDNVQLLYAKSNPECTSYECNLWRYFGGDNPYTTPKMVENGKGSNLSSEFEASVAAFHHNVVLDDEAVTEYIIGDLDDDISKNQQMPDFDAELERACKKWEELLNGFHIQSENKQLEYMTNYWLKKQVVYLTKHNRGGVYCPVRNQLQDALGYSMIDAKDAFEYALRVLKRQEENGYLKQWYMTDNSPETGLCRINHSDAPIWLVICMIEIIRQTGDESLFDMQIKYFKSEKSDSIKEHLKNAVRYMSTQLGEHGLCLMKDGDWTDPINGAGRLGKGESAWNTMALVYAIKKLNEICNEQWLVDFASQLTESINQYCWNEDRYIVGIDDNGIPFGKRDDKKASLFLNTQTWALIAGISSEEQIKILKHTIETMKTEYGYLLLYPPFDEYDSLWGKISVKQKGATENGSIYAHATMFKAYADCLTDDFDSALQTMSDLIPDTENGIQAPLYLPNYYFGARGDNFGRSSCVFSSGAPAWLLWVMKTYFSN